MAVAKLRCCLDPKLEAFIVPSTGSLNFKLLYVQILLSTVLRGTRPGAGDSSSVRGDGNRQGDVISVFA